MRWQKVGTLVATILIVVIAAAILFPVYADHAVLGLDLQGGVMVRLEAPEGTTQEEMEAAKSVIENRTAGRKQPDFCRTARCRGCGGSSARNRDNCKIAVCAV